MLKLSGKFIRKKCGFYLSCLLGVGLLAACEAEESCVSFATNLYKVGFLTFNEKGGAEPVGLNFELIEASGTDSLMFARKTANVEGVVLALDPASDTSTFLFRYRYGADTLQLTYERLFHMISPECGVELRYRNLEVSYHTFDSLSLLNDQLQSSTQGADLQIFQLQACQSRLRSRVEAGFFGLNAANESKARTLQFDRIWALESEEVFYEGEENGINQIGLELSPAGGASATTFIFESGDVADTLRLGFNQQQVVLRPECGLDTLFSNLRVIEHTFDSVSLLTPVLPETNDGFDVEIYP